MRTPKHDIERRSPNRRGRQLLRRKAGGAVRPHREDGYVNLLNKYGTKNDNSEAYSYEREPIIPDTQLTGLYEGNGLFSKIIDTPAEEALKHGFELGLNSDELDAFVEDALDDLEWEEKAATAIKWARLYGGALMVMLIDDGHGLEEPVDWKHIKSIDELRVYERAIVQPDYSSLYRQDYSGKGKGNRVSKFGKPEFYYVSSIYGSFIVHESRCLVFSNGVLPEQTSNATYRFWGMPEYIRIRRALRETITAHTDSTKLLERSVQAIYSMKNLAQLLATDEGENQVLKRLEIIDMARGLLNSIAIDSDGENYDFKTFQFTGVKDVIDATCNMLSALTNIPQTILFGRSPAGMNSTGTSDLENYYNFVERIQKLMLKRNLRSLLDIVFRAGVKSGDIDEEPDYKLKFNPLWSLSETEQAAVDQTRAQTAQTKAQTAQIYVDMQALDPSEVRRRLAEDEDFDVEDIITEDDDLLKDLLGGSQNVMNEVEAAQKNAEEEQAPGGPEQTAFSESSAASMPSPSSADRADGDTVEGVGVLVLRDGKILTGTRIREGTLCGPGGHIKDGETPEQAAVRESREEFGIDVNELIPLDVLTGMPDGYCDSHIFLCTEYDGKITCDGHEMSSPSFMSMEELSQIPQERLFLPFAKQLDVLMNLLFDGGNPPLTSVSTSDKMKEVDGGSGSGNFGHEGRKGKVGGSAPSSGSEAGKSAGSQKQSGKKAKVKGGSSGTGSGSEKKVGSTSEKKSSGEAKKTVVASPDGKNEACIGFASPEKFKRHAQKHGPEFGEISAEEYQQRGIDFLKQPCGGDIDGYATSDGKVVRFNRVTTEYASGYPGGVITTYMRAKFNTKKGQPNVDLANAYFDSCKEKGR